LLLVLSPAYVCAHLHFLCVLTILVPDGPTLFQQCWTYECMNVSMNTAEHAVNILL